MKRHDAALPGRRAAEALETLKAAQAERARAALGTVGRRAKEAQMRARGRALAQIDRGRSAAATRLEGLVDAIRPLDHDHLARARRRAAAIAGASGVALVAAVGLGVALGMMWSRRLRQKDQVRERLAASETTPHPATQVQDPTATPAAPIVY